MKLVVCALALVLAAGLAPFVDAPAQAQEARNASTSDARSRQRPSRRPPVVASVPEIDASSGLAAVAAIAAALALAWDRRRTV